MPSWALDVVRELSERRISDLERLGVRVVGDPEVLRVPADVPVAEAPLETPAVEAPIAAAAVAAVMRVALRLEDDRSAANEAEDGASDQGSPGGKSAGRRLNRRRLPHTAVVFPGRGAAAYIRQ